MAAISGKLSSVTAHCENQVIKPLSTPEKEPRPAAAVLALPNETGGRCQER
jgi:hypothetical protein